MRFVDKSLLESEDFGIEVLRLNFLTFPYLSEILRENKNLVKNIKYRLLKL